MRTALRLFLLPIAAFGHDTGPLFFLYEGEAFRNMTEGLVNCYRERNGRPPWSDSYLFSEHTTEMWIHRALIEHPRRTREPERAALFFVPAYLALSATQTCEDCEAAGGSHQQRMAAVVAALQKSVWFRRFGGSDHAIVCSSTACRKHIDVAHRAALGRVILGALEPGNPSWHGWPCGNRVVAVPYAARTSIEPKSAARPPSARSKLFFFHGSDRRTTGRRYLSFVAAAFGAKADIVVHGIDDKLRASSSVVDEDYPERIVDSRFCFAPRGDSSTSRRIYDAIAAGCIPVIPELVRSRGNLPFASEVPYGRFAVIVPDAAFESVDALLRLAKRLAEMPLLRVDAMHAELMRWRNRFTPMGGSGGGAKATAVAAAANATFDDLPWSRSLGSAFANAALRVVSDSAWSCGPSPGARKGAGENAQRELAALAASMTYPSDGAGRPDEWLVDNEVHVYLGRKLLMCDVPGAGAAPLQNAISLALGGESGSLPPVGAADHTGLQAAYSNSWVQARVVRDPVTRLLEAYLEYEAEGRDGDLEAGFRALVVQLAAAADSGAINLHPLYRPQAGFCGARYRQFAAQLPYESLRQDGEALLRSLDLWDAAKPFWPHSGANVAATRKGDGGLSGLSSDSGAFVGDGGGIGGTGGGLGGYGHPASMAMGAASLAAAAAVMPLRDLSSASSMSASGAMHVAPVGFWEMSAWASDSADGAPRLRSRITATAGSGAGGGGSGTAAPFPADELFAGCGWARFYDPVTLALVEHIYAEDYRQLAWYSVEGWHARYRACQQQQ